VSRAYTSGALLLAVPLVLLGQYAACALVDGGHLRSGGAFYAAALSLPLLTGLAMRRELKVAVAIAVLAMLGTGVLYKLGIQNGYLSEHGNAFDWVLILLLSGILIVGPGLLLLGTSGSKGVNASA
jgi:hypothetical protein